MHGIFLLLLNKECMKGFGKQEKNIREIITMKINYRSMYVFIIIRTIHHEIYFKASQNNIDAGMSRAIMKNTFFLI